MATKELDKDPHIMAAREYGASSSDVSMLANFKSRVAEFQAARGELQKIGAAIARTNDMEAWRQYGELVARADSIESKVTAALRAIDSTLSAARAAIGLDGVRALAGLGFVWVLPIAIIAAALAVLGYWLSDYAKFAARYREQQRVASDLVAQGVDPIEAQRQASAVVAAAAPRTFGESLGGVLKFGAILAAGLYVWHLYRRG